MSASLMYRAVAVLFVLFTVGHTLGFSRVDPAWGVSAPISALQSTVFTAQGTPGRTYWGFYLGFGYFCSALMLLATALAWQLGTMPPETLRSMQFLSWSFAATFLLATAVVWKFFFTAAMVFSTLIAIGLLVAAWRARVT